ncbi:MAG: hypothetical protein ACI9SG_000134 [Maribacter sp.]|jgi:hypothetical protein
MAVFRKWKKDNNGLKLGLCIPFYSNSKKPFPKAKNQSKLNLPIVFDIEFVI